MMHLLPKEEKKFLAFINSQNQLASHSQLHQDFLPNYFLGKSEPGYFIEVGVGNGISNSNTYLLENEFGYRGILVEPNRKFLDSLNENRNALILNCAAGSTDNQSVILFGTDDGEYSYIANEFAGDGKRRESILNQPILTKTLNSILMEAKAPQVIEFLSIDVEGYEIEVLRGLDLAEWKFKVVCIEHNYNEQKRSQILEIFTSYGYRHVLPVASQFDSFFVLPELLVNSK
jgi:FkbM family methyltransferase